MISLLWWLKSLIFAFIHYFNPNMKLRIQLVGFVLAAILVSTSAFGQISASGSFSLQGRLTNMSNDAPIPDGQHQLKVSVYKKGIVTAIYSENDTVSTSGGLFKVLVKSQVMDATTPYEVGIALDGAAEMAPHIEIASSPRSIASNVSDTSAIALNLGAHALDSNVVSSLNGVHGAVNIMGGGSLVVTPTGQNIALSFTGTGAGLTLPYTGLMPIANGSLFTLTNTSTGTAASFINSSTGGALLVRDSLGSAISAFSKGQNATIDASNTGGVAVNALSTINAAVTATTNSNVSPAVIVKNTASAGSIEYFQALNYQSIPVMDLASTGLKVMTGAGVATDAVLKLQNTTPLLGNLIAAMDNNGSALFTLGASGTGNAASLTNTALTATDTAGTAISATTTAANGPVLRIQNNSNSANAGILTALGSSGTVLAVAGNGTTRLTAFGAGSTALSVTNNTGTAVSAASTVAAGPVLQVQNMSTAATGALITAKDSLGNAILNVGVNGGTQLRSSVTNALDVSTTAVGGTAAKITGGLSLVGPAGTATIATGQTSVSVTNAFAKSTSIILTTINSALTTLSPIRVSATNNGNFTVSLLSGVAIGSDVVFNYLIVNTQ